MAISKKSLQPTIAAESLLLSPAGGAAVVGWSGWALADPFRGNIYIWQRAGIFFVAKIRQHGFETGPCCWIWNHMGSKKTKPLRKHVTTQNNLQKNINTPNASQSICIRQAKMYVEVFFAILRLQHECLAKLVPHVVILNHTDAWSGNGCFAKLLEFFALDQKPLTHLLSFTQLLPSPATIAELNKKVMFWLCGTPHRLSASYV